MVQAGDERPPASLSSKSPPVPSPSQRQACPAVSQCKPSLPIMKITLESEMSAQPSGSASQLVLRTPKPSREPTTVVGGRIQHLESGWKSRNRGICSGGTQEGALGLQHYWVNPMIGAAGPTCCPSGGLARNTSSRQRESSGRPQTLGLGPPATPSSTSCT